jgi:succinate dehydrogenase / fumarate reductase cytochrome b subunit
MSTAEAIAPSRRGSFVQRRLGSIVGLLPLGVWTLNHLWDNLAAFAGDEEWQNAVTGYEHPAVHVATLIVVLVPLVMHTVWGLGRLRTVRANFPKYGFFGNIKYILQRLSAVGLLGFLGAHLWLAMLKPRLVDGSPEDFYAIAHEMRFHGPTLVVYLLGTLAVSYHLANGFATAAMGWGLVGTRSALRSFERASYALFALLLAMSWGAIYALWSAGALTTGLAR